MAAADILFETPDGLLAIVADAVLVETHRVAAVATENEVEEGVDITDHYRAERAPLDLQLAISDSPIESIEADDPEWFAFEAPGATEGVELRPPGLPAFTAQVFRPSSEEITRTADNWAALELARDEGYLATVRTQLKTYESMVLLSAEAQRTSDRGSLLVADLVFVPIRQVATELVDVAEPVRPRDQRGRDQGAQGTDDVEDEPQTSLALQAWRGIFG